MPGHWNHWELTDKVAQGVRVGGPIEIHTIAVNGRITTGPTRMKTSRVSREIIADAVSPGATGCGGLRQRIARVEFRRVARRRLGVRAQQCLVRPSVRARLSSCSAVVGLPCRIRLRRCPPLVIKAELNALRRATSTRKETCHVRQALG
jgi:hypothetical protein